MHIVYAVLWLTDGALFSEQRKGVAPVEREGAGYTDALFWGEDGGKCNGGKNTIRGLWIANRLPLEAPPIRSAAPAVCP